MKLKKIFMILAIFGLIFPSFSALAEENATSTNPLPKIIPVVSNVEITNISSNQALISWLSNYSDVSYLKYGVEDTTSGLDLVGSNRNREKVTNHQVILTDLKPATTYYFRIVLDFDTSTMTETQSYKFTTQTESLNSLIVVKNSNGSGLVFSNSSSGQNTTINCGDLCKADFPANTVVVLNAVAKEGSTFVGWEGDCKLDTPNQCTITLNNSKVVSAKFELKSTIDPNDRNVPRIMYWWGKVNQHWNIDKGAWETDSDGASGADLDKLTYCKKFYPNTIKVEEYKNETAAIWRDRGNINQYTSVKMSYRCIQETVTIDPNDKSVPRIMYWWGKVNQHWNIDKGAWETDSDGASGADLDKLTYCKKFYPNTIKVEEYKNETSAIWHDRGNLNQYHSIKMSYRCIQGEGEIKPEPIFIGPPVSENSNAPRIMFWYGKVNQHWNVDKGTWETDADGVSGANLDKLTYCKKFYPKTIKVEEYKNETSAIWHDRGNVNQYTSVKMSYLCIQGEGEIKPNPIFIGPPETIDEIQPAVKPYIEVKTETTERGREEEADKTKYEVTEISGKIEDNANSQISKLLEELKQLRNRVSEQETEIKYLKGLQQGVKSISAEAKTSITDFITYGVDANTQKLGSGERAAVVASYKAAYNKLPETSDDITETIKIANGRFPSIISQTAEDKANEEFRKIYGREVDLNNQNDVAAIKVMAYGLRQKAENRKLESEKKGIEIFKNIYGHVPQTTEEWNAMQAITYSGAKK